MEGTTPFVLVAEDEPELAEVYVRWLSDDYEVRIAHDGEAALAELSSDVDVVLLDRRMPGLTGDEVLDRIEARGLDCRVAMVTAVDPDFDIVEMGFDAYLRKPVKKDDILSAVERLVSLSAYDREVRELYSVASKTATLEAEKPSAELESDERYARLERRFTDLADRVDGAINGVGEEGYRALFRDLDGGSRSD